MSGRLFRIDGTNVTELPGTHFKIERDLQRLLEQHLPTFLGIRFLASEYSTGARHGGRIDTLGLDENNFPVILEYKRHTNDSVINQGLYYLDWLVNSKAEFRLLVQEQLGTDVAAEINWSNPRLICVAGDFTRYDSYAVQQINRSIELVRYVRYGEAHLMLEPVNTPVSPTTPRTLAVTPATGSAALTDPTNGSGTVTPDNVETTLRKGSGELQARFAALDEFIRSMLDVQMKPTKLYFAYRKLRNFATVVPGPTKNELWLYLHLQPGEIDLDPRFMRDVSSVGHWGTGNLEITLANDEDLESVKPLIRMAYEAG